MIRQALKITLLEDCVFSASTATAGGHQTLDRVPGQALLGAAASQIYAGLSADEAFAIFHSGRFRFGDGLPCQGDSVALPVPLCWYHYKGEDPEHEVGHRLNPKRMLNLLHAQTDASRQPVQLRNGYVLADGRRLRPRTRLRLKTAIAPDTGRAAEAQLFGYDSLLKGQQFIAELQCDDDLEQQMKQVVESLNGERLIGRSRSAEYGRVRIEPLKDVHNPRSGEAGNELSLLLLSDLALVDENGQATLEPRPELLGLGSGTIDWQRSWLRNRRYSVWNQYRNGHDRERVVITAGSVITLKLNEAPKDEALTALESGVGRFCECGLGRILVNPDLLSGEHPQFNEINEATADVNAATRPDNPLIAWLENKTGVRDIEMDRLAEEIARDFSTLVERARRLAGVGSDQSFGPSKSQWGTVLEAARHTPGQQLFAHLFEGDNACIKPSAKGWSEEVQNAENQWQTLAQALAAKLNRNADNSPTSGLDDREYSALVRRLARRLLSRSTDSSQPDKGVQS